MSRGRLRPAGLEIDEVELDIGVAQFDLAFDLIKGPGGLICRVDYDTSLFEADPSIGCSPITGGCWRRSRPNLASHLGTVAHVRGRTPQAARRLERDDGRFPARSLPPRAVPRQARRTPDRPAIVDGDDVLSYAELDRRSDRIARRLRGPGRRPGRAGRPAAWSARPSWWSAMLGVLKAGGAYVPLDPAYPADRLACMLADARAPVLLTRARTWLDRLPADGARRLCLDAERTPDAAGAPPTPARRRRRRRRDLAYVIYTSGSTGRAQGRRGAAPRPSPGWSAATDYAPAGRPPRSSCSSPRSRSTPRRSRSGAPLLHGARCVGRAADGPLDARRAGARPSAARGDDACG